MRFGNGDGMVGRWSATSAMEKRKNLKQRSCSRSGIWAGRWDKGYGIVLVVWDLVLNGVVWNKGLGSGQGFVGVVWAMGRDHEVMKTQTKAERRTLKAKLNS
ncbi:unnamed protein product [Citrullus colocynthis]|uniref:Uncharacterized protein n=1 Tax=Citrullus colocynthis TaxID=252529 RepID=A0ABP0XME0_9ROSI